MIWHRKEWLLAIAVSVLLVIATRANGQPAGGVSPSINTVRVKTSIVSIDSSTLYGGLAVTVTGTGFGTDEGIIDINQTVTPPSYWSDNEVRFLVPYSVEPKTKASLTIQNSATGRSGSISVDVVAKVFGIDPPAGSAGAIVTILGTTFGTTQRNVTVGGQNAAVLGWSPQRIDAIIPGGLVPGNYNVFIYNSVESAPYQVTEAIPAVLRPSISSFSPTSGYAGDVISIFGSGFGATQTQAGAVFVEGVEASIAYWSSTRIDAVIPETVGPVNQATVVVAAGGDFNKRSGLRVLPSIWELLPTASPVGKNVLLIGANLGNQVGSVWVGGQPAQILSWEMLGANFEVPKSLVPGIYDVYVQDSQRKLDSNSVAISVLPEITGVTPGGGAADTSIQVFGANFGFSQGSSLLKLAGVSVSPTSWSDTLSSFLIPPNIPAGNQQLSVTVNGQTSAGIGLTVIPTLTAPNPAIGTGGTSIVVNAKNVGAVQGDSVLTVGGVVVPVTNWSETSIEFVVPNDIIPGSQDVIAVVGGQSSNVVPITILPNIQSIEPISGGFGTEVTLHVSNFGSSQGNGEAFLGLLLRKLFRGA